ncbi:hypothetical protein EVAR_19898_1 [Eumeta japonica]|uniref:Uncharacterized protein n=1 Tax=Eumeta variegata TaxID=151549 RepID=A0A4C1XKL5_EUMVA|nr:hypothetical protein EVAR_19898_1 [Eumeta japonica]
MKVCLINCFSAYLKDDFAVLPYLEAGFNRWHIKGHELYDRCNVLKPRRRNMRTRRLKYKEDLRIADDDENLTPEFTDEFGARARIPFLVLRADHPPIELLLLTLEKNDNDFPP